MDKFGTDTHTDGKMDGEVAHTLAASSKLGTIDSAHNDPHAEDGVDARTAVGRGTYNSGRNESRYDGTYIPYAGKNVNA